MLRLRPYVMLLKLLIVVLGFLLAEPVPDLASEGVSRLSPRSIRDRVPDQALKCPAASRRVMGSSRRTVRRSVVKGAAHDFVFGFPGPIVAPHILSSKCRSRVVRRET